MADNVTIPAQGTGDTTPVVATDDVGSVHYQKIKIALGADGAVDTLVDSGQQTMANSVPVVLASDHSDIKITLDSESITISGTVQVQSNSANLATEATAAAIQTAVELIDNAISGSEMQVDLVGGGPIGATTDAEASGDGSVIAILKRLRTLLGGTLTVSASQLDIDNLNKDDDELLIWANTAKDGTGTDYVPLVDSDGNLQIDIVASLPAGTNAIGKLAANSGVDIGDVDVTSVIPGSAASNLGKAEDAAHASGDVGVMALSVRQDTAAATSDTDGDYQPLTTDANGRLHVLDQNSAAMLADTASMDTNLGTVAGAVDGSEMQVDVVAALPAGDNNIGNVDIVTGPTGASALEVQGAETENGAVTGGPVLAGGRYDATPRALDDGDAGAIALAADGAVHIDDGGNTITVDGTVTANAGTNLNTSALALESGGNLADIKTAVELIDNAISGSEMQVDVVASLPAGTNAIGKLAANDGVDIGDVSLNNGFASVVGGGTEATALRVTIANDSTGVVSVDDGGGALTVDGTVTANLSATDNAVLDQIEVNTSYGDNTGGGTETGALRVTIANDSTGVVSVDDNGSTLSVDDGGGALTIDGTVTASNAAGDVAHDSADSGNPIKTGGKAKNFDGSAPGTAVAEDDRVNFIADVYGRQFVETTHPNHFSVNGNYAAAQTNTQLKAAPGAGLKIYITDVVMSTDGACNISLEDEDDNDLIPPMYFAANGGAALHFQTPIPMTTNKALEIDSSAAVNHSILVNGYIAP